MTDRRKELGAAGEAAAERYLRKLGYVILHRNLRLGRTGEIDLVVRDKSVLAFVEVKSRLQGEVLGGVGNITATKQNKLRLLGEMYLQQHVPGGCAARFDAVEVEFNGTGDRDPVVRHLIDAFR